MVNRLLLPIVLCLIALAAALRVAGVFDDFWLDEIWTWQLLRPIRSPWDVFTLPAALTDNNHPLNTLLMWYIGHHMHYQLYRVPAVAAGVGAVVLAAVILRRRGPVEALLGVLLVGFSYPLIFYSSEARGYALIVFFALLAFDALDRFLRSGGWVPSIVYIVACILGVAAHLTFVYFFAAAVVWSLASFVRGGRGRASIALASMQLHLIPVAWMGFLYVYFVRRLTIGGAPTQDLTDALRNAVAGLLGAGDATAAGIAATLVFIGLLVALVRTLHRSDDSLWIFIVTVIAAPVIVVGLQIALVERRQPIHARYFLVPFVFFLLGLAVMLGTWFRMHGAWRIAAASLLGAFLLTNLYQTVQFLRVGRGHYADAVAQMAALTFARSPVPVIVVSSDHPWRTGLVLDFYAKLLPPQQQMIIYDDSNAPNFAPRTHGPPMFVVIHSNLRGQPPTQAFDQYVFDREFPYYGLSGYSWYLYRHRSIPPSR